MAEPDRSFLNVDESLTGQKWVERATRVQLGQAQIMREQYDIDEIVGRVLAGRDVSAENAMAFLDPKLRDLMPDPSVFADMDRAAERLADAIEFKQSVAIFGDYDVDGAASSALLHKYLKHWGNTCEIHIPDRIFEGYGPNATAIRQLIDNGAQLLVTVDCGSTSHEALAQATKLGVDVVVLDHHQVDEQPLDVTAFVNPNRHDDLSGQGHLCAAGVVFMTLVALNRELRKRKLISDASPAPDLMMWLDLVALATVCDVVPLKGLNRAFVLRGIEIMRQRKNIGLSALAKAARQDGPAAPWHLGFLLGPRINAGGRIGDAALGAKLLTTENPTDAEEIAVRLDVLNGERQAMEAAMLKEAIDEADAEIGLGEGPAVIVTERETWHPGVVGLLASRLKDRFNRPAFAIAFDGEGVGAGSGRSINGVDLGRCVREAVETGLLVKGGGHAMAAGLTINRAKLGDFRRFLEDHLGEQVTQVRENQVLKIDGALSARAATISLFDRIEKAGPFGSAHSQPVYAFPNHTLQFSDIVGQNHVRFSLRSPDGAELRGIGFRIAETPLGQALLEGRGKVMHFAGMLSKDFYRGNQRIQLRLLDAAPVPDRL